MTAEKDAYEVGLKKARAFFGRAEEVASTENFDYGIDLYLEGLNLSPDALEDGHLPLRKLALLRQDRGGKKPSMMEKMKRLKGKGPKEEMINAEYLLAKDPDNLQYAEAMLKAAVAGSFLRTAEWLALFVFDANRAADKPSFATYILLKDCFVKMKMFTRAVNACEHALKLKPKDDALRDELRDLSASMTMEKGKYGKTNDFRDSIRDKESQDKLHRQEYAIKNEDDKKQAVLDAQKKIQAGEVTVTNILALADALFAMGSAEGDEEGVRVLRNAHEQSKDFTFLKRLGEFRLKKLKNQMRQLNKQIAKEQDNETLKNQFKQVQKQLDEVELEHYKKCQENYPTDLKMKYEYGRCLVKAKQFDAAIPMLQEAQKDPRLRVLSMDKMGICFLLKGWLEDATEIFEEALKNCINKESAVAKNIRYNLARSYELRKMIDEALKVYRKLAQSDFSYKDVGQRIDKLRKNVTN